MTCPMFYGHTCSILLIMYFLSLNWIIADLQCCSMDTCSILLIMYFLSLNWIIADLQCCVNFCCIEKWFIYTYTYMLFHILFHYDLSQAIKYSFLGTTVAPYPSPVLCIVRLCLLSPDAPSSPHPLLVSLGNHVCPLCLWVCFLLHM